MCRCKGELRFSLVELMIIVAIVSLLASMMFPVFAQALATSRQAVCTNNLRQLGNLSQIYEDELLPASFGATTDGGLHHWLNWMGHRADSGAKLMQCPEMSSEEMFDPAGHDPAAANVFTKASYIMNIIKPGQWQGSGLGGNSRGWRSDLNDSFSRNQVVQPSKTIWIGDVKTNLSNAHMGVQSFRMTNHGMNMEQPVGNVRRVGDHHRKKSFNTLLGDGHVENKRTTTPVEWDVFGGAPP